MGHQKIKYQMIKCMCCSNNIPFLDSVEISKREWIELEQQVFRIQQNKNNKGRRLKSEEQKILDLKNELLNFNDAYLRLKKKMRYI